MDAPSRLYPPQKAGCFFSDPYKVRRTLHSCTYTTVMLNPTDIGPRKAPIVILYVAIVERSFSNRPYISRYIRIKIKCILNYNFLAKNSLVGSLRSALHEQNYVAKLGRWSSADNERAHDTIDTNLVYHSSRDLHLSNHRANQSFPGMSGAVTLRYRENVTDSVTVLLLEA